jgi:pyruvate carboxylase
MTVALNEFSLLGVRTTADLLRSIVESEKFARGDLSTHFVPEFFDDWSNDDTGFKLGLIVAASGAANDVGVSRAAQYDGSHRSSTLRGRSPWQEIGDFELWRSRPGK